MGRNRAACKGEAQCREGVCEAAKRAVALVDTLPAYTQTLPMTLKLVLTRSDYCDEMAARPGIRRLSAREVEKTVSTLEDVLF